MTKKKSKKKYIIIAIVLIVLIAGYAWISSNAKKAMGQILQEYVTETTVETGIVEVKITGKGVVEPLKRYPVTAPLSGEIKSISVDEGDTVKKDNTLFKVGDTNIKAPTGGRVISINVTKGEYLSGATSSTMTTAAEPNVVIADMSKLKFTMEVDEIDVLKVKTDMQVEVTADALDGESFIGKVTKIASEGKSTNGVTVYAVTIEIENYGDLKIGMNVDASLIIDKKENVLVVPMSAINKTKTETYVYVKDTEYVGTEQDNAMSILNMPTNMSEVRGYKKQNVEVGLKNKDEIEVISGLNAGDKIYSISTSKGIAQYMTGGAGMSMGM